MGEEGEEGEVTMEVNMEVNVEAEKMEDWEVENEAKEEHVETKKEEVNRRHCYTLINAKWSLAECDNIHLHTTRLV